MNKDADPTQRATIERHQLAVFLVASSGTVVVAAYGAGSLESAVRGGSVVAGEPAFEVELNTSWPREHGSH